LRYHSLYNSIIRGNAMDSTIQQNKYFRQMKEAEAADFINVSREKLRADRCKGIGAPFRRYGRSIRYDLGELTTWMAAQSTAAKAIK
jgi:hypothetical protein